MRTQLFAGGLLVAATGAGFYLLAFPLVFFWSIPFGVVGVIMAVASVFLPEGQGPIKPPDGYRFCVYCSSEVPIASERCPHCNGVQPKES